MFGWEAIMARVSAFLRLSLLVLLGAFVAGPPAQAAEVVGVVLMHGKWSPGPKFIASLADRLQEAGYLVATPDMPWSASRMYDVSYEAAMGEIDQAVARLKEKGATRIVVGGHSMGANAALGYGARRPGLLAVMAIGPGHSQDLEDYRRRAADDVATAKAMLADGHGDDTASFNDWNQGRSRTVRNTAAVFLSYQDPEGPAVMPVNASRLTAPLLVVVGTEDHLYPLGQGYIFDKAPADPRNKYLVVSANHLGTPATAAGDIVAWLNGLRRE